LPQVQPLDKDVHLGVSESQVPVELFVVDVNTSPHVNPAAEIERRRTYHNLVITSAGLFAHLISQKYNVNDAIDVIVSDPDFHEDMAKHRHAVAHAPRRNSADWVAEAFSAPALGDATAAKFLEPAGRALRCLIELDAEAQRHRLNHSSALTSEEDQRRDLLWFMADPLVHPDVADCMLAGVRSVVGLQLLNNFGWVKEILQELAAVFAEDVQKYIRAHASILGDRVPTSIVPACDRLDLAVLRQSQDEIREALDDLAGRFQR